jgi:hypothetical protein
MQEKISAGETFFVPNFVGEAPRAAAHARSSAAPLAVTHAAKADEMGL